MAPDVRTLVQRIFDEIINEGRLEATDELIAPDFLDHGPMGVIAGREGFKSMVAQWRSAVPDVCCTIENVVTDGELVGWLVRATGTHTGDGLGFPATGKPFDTVSANLGRVRDGMAVEHWSEQGMLPMLIQLDLLPLPASPAP